jgi:hypothetical protein
MIDGFHSARNLPDILASLSSFLGEMEFSRAEVRVPITAEKDIVLDLKNWVAIADGPHHGLYRWSTSGCSAADVLSTHFRLEFVFRIPNQDSQLISEFPEMKGRDIGRLTFYHPTTAHLPVSAVCLLSRQVWTEFEKSVNRIMSPSAAQSGSPKAARRFSVLRLLHDAPAIARLPVIWAAPILSRMITHSRR